MHWFHKDWWSYLLQRPISIKAIICRLRGHPYGVVWHTSRWEPDMTCLNCGDDLG